MTAQEKLSLQKLSDQLESFMEDDKKWKDEVTKQLTPLVEERFDRQVIQKYGSKAIKTLAFIIGILASAGAAWRYLLSPLFPHLFGK